MELGTRLLARIREAGIDLERSLQILDDINGTADSVSKGVRATGIPEIDGTNVVNRRGPGSFTVSDERYRELLGEMAPEIPSAQFGSVENGYRSLDNDDLATIGTLLTPYVAYGILNGGSATSYGDTKKNAAFDPALFELYEPEFSALAKTVHDQPKGVTPAFVQPDGSAGPSFLELKFRHLLFVSDRYRRIARQFGIPASESPIPVFEMTSPSTEEPLRAAYNSYRSSSLLEDVPGRDAILETKHAVQPMLTAFTHSAEGKPRRVFDRAFGAVDTPLGLPGGHGQNFQVLAPIYRQLRKEGKRFVYLGNVDNLGCTVDPVSLSLLALSGKSAGFDFAFRTPVDVKGGVLVFDQTGHLNCADIGPAISKEEVFAAEGEGKRVLFNCATGLFDLEYLTTNVDQIVRKLPVRISDQDKDAGRYSQAEQVTWEVIGMIDEVLIFAIDKYRRFLAAKMLMETLLTSGIKRDRAREIQSTVDDLFSGLERVLTEEYAMEKAGGMWKAAPIRSHRR